MDLNIYATPSLASLLIGRSLAWTIFLDTWYYTLSTFFGHNTVVL